VPVAKHGTSKYVGDGFDEFEQLKALDTRASALVQKRKGKS
jgi:hypothetical protein